MERVALRVATVASRNLVGHPRRYFTDRSGRGQRADAAIPAACRTCRPRSPLFAAGMAGISPAASSPDNVRRRMGLQRRQGLARRRRLDLIQDALQRADTGRERVSVAVNCVFQQPREGGGFVIGLASGRPVNYSRGLQFLTYIASRAKGNAP
jgi:hypothetical protein